MSDKQFKKNKEDLMKEAFKGKKSFNDKYGRRVTEENAEADHIVPKSKGGNDTKNNLEIISRKSNREKSDKLSGTMSNGTTYKVNRSTKNKNQGTSVVTKRKK